MLPTRPDAAYARQATPHVAYAPKLNYTISPSSSPFPKLTGFAILAAIIGALVLFLRKQPPELPDGKALPTGNGTSIILAVLILGIIIGLVVAWISIVILRRRIHSTILNLAQSTQLVATTQVFVSYSHEDLAAVDRLVQQIEGMGYAVWIDRLATGSQRYAAPIVRAIRTSKLVALMCSQNAFSSDHVVREIYVAGDLRKPFIAFQLDQSDIPDDVLYFVTGFPRIPIRSVNPQQLRSEIARLIAD